MLGYIGYCRERATYALKEFMEERAATPIGSRLYAERVMGKVSHVVERATQARQFIHWAISGLIPESTIHSPHWGTRGAVVMPRSSRIRWRQHGAMDPSLLQHFSLHGWALFPEVIDRPSLDLLREQLRDVYPPFEEFDGDQERSAGLADGQFGGLRLWPLDDLALDLLPVESSLVGLAERLLGTTELRLLRAGYQAKYARTADFDQVLHYDYPNHSLVVPADDEVVGFFLYLSDVTDELGSTALVSDTVRGPVTPGRTHLDPAAHPDFYAAEQRAPGSAGSVLAYRSTTYHRGTAITAEAGVRLTLGYSYGRPAPWTGFMSFPRLGEEPGLVRAVVNMTPRQRQLLGFPAPGDDYWTPATAQAVAERYPGLDPAPYF